MEVDTQDGQTQATFSLVIKWNREELSIQLPASQTVSDLKLYLHGVTDVPVDRQKLLGLKDSHGKAANDELILKDIKLMPKQKIIMMGTPAPLALVEPNEGEFQVVDDFDTEDTAQTLAVHQNEIFLKKIRNRIETLEVKVMNPPRDGKKCLVLDIDYTLFDHKSSVDHPHEMMRPHLHDFLKAVYPFYDIILWSATTMKWIDLKMKSLGVFSHSEYKITLCLDRMAMITVATEWKGHQKVFDTKGLAVLWGKFSKHYHSKNTIHFDDLSRNFIMNPQNGLKIKPFKNCRLNKGDTELLRLAEYLLGIAHLDDFSSLNHNSSILQEWEDWVEKKLRR